jgi:hypothetical protein
VFCLPYFQNHYPVPAGNREDYVDCAVRNSHINMHGPKSHNSFGYLFLISTAIIPTLSRIVPVVVNAASYPRGRRVNADQKNLCNRDIRVHGSVGRCARQFERITTGTRSAMHIFNAG